MTNDILANTLKFRILCNLNDKKTVIGLDVMVKMVVGLDTTVWLAEKAEPRRGGWLPTTARNWYFDGEYSFGIIINSSPSHFQVFGLGGNSIILA